MYQNPNQPFARPSINGQQPQTWQNPGFQPGQVMPPQPAAFNPAAYQMPVQQQFAQPPANQPQFNLYAPAPPPSAPVTPTQPWQQPHPQAWQQPVQQPPVQQNPNVNPYAPAPQWQQPAPPAQAPGNVGGALDPAAILGQLGDGHSSVDPSLALAYQNYFAQQAAAASGQQAPINPFMPPQPEEWSIEKHFQQLYGAPEWKPEFQAAVDSGLVVKDSNGMWAPASTEVAAMANAVLPGMNHHEQHRVSAISGIFNDNPYQNIWGAMEKPIEQMIENKAQELVETTLDRRDTEQFLNDYISKNRPWMYTVDQSGHEVLTQAGAQMQAHAKQLYDQGVDARLAVEYAEARAKPVEAPQPQPVTTPQTLGPDPTTNQIFRQTPANQPMVPPQMPPYLGAYQPQPQAPQPPAAQQIMQPGGLAAMPQFGNAGQQSGPSVLPPDPGANMAPVATPSWMQASTDPLPNQIPTATQQPSSPFTLSPTPQTNPQPGGSFLQNANGTAISQTSNMSASPDMTAVPTAENISVAESDLSNYWNRVGEAHGY